MVPQLAKSPCCSYPVVRFGQRRRQCKRCQKTWSIRPKKRGRPRKPAPEATLASVFLKGYTLGHLAARRPGVMVPAFRHRFRQTLKRFVGQKNRTRLPRGPLILLMDGLWFRFSGKPWVLYLIALKACRGNRAVFLDPLLLEGMEGLHRWEQAVATIPVGARRRIRGLVVDNLRGMEKLARHHSWALQLCQFHLLLKLQVQRNRPHRALKGGKVRQEIYRLVRGALELPTGPLLYKTIDRLRELAKTKCGTKRIRAMVREFLRCAGFYRTCRTRQELGLPSTTNSVEAMGGLLRNLLRRNRAGSSKRALLLWTTALIRMRPHIACNGKFINRI